MKKILTGLLAGAIMLGIGMLIGQVFQYFVPELKNEYQNPNLFRPWSDPLMSLYFVVPFITGLILVFIWEMTKGIIKGNSMIEKGFNFGIIYWVIGIPGMIMSYSSFPLTFILVSSWTITALFQALVSGLLFSKMLK